MGKQRLRKVQSHICSKHPGEMWVQAAQSRACALQHHTVPPSLGSKGQWGKNTPKSSNSLENAAGSDSRHDWFNSMLAFLFTTGSSWICLISQQDGERALSFTHCGELGFHQACFLTLHEIRHLGRPKWTMKTLEESFRRTHTYPWPLGKGRRVSTRNGQRNGVTLETYNLLGVGDKEPSSPLGYYGSLICKVGYALNKI